IGHYCSIDDDVLRPSGTGEQQFRKRSFEIMERPGHEQYFLSPDLREVVCEPEPPLTSFEGELSTQLEGPREVMDRPDKPIGKHQILRIAIKKIADVPSEIEEIR